MPSVVPVRILVVDDNQDGADSLSMLLRLWGFEARAVYVASDAIRIAREFKPDCILSDIQMPDLDGYQVAEGFRKDDEFKHVPLIAISGTYDLLRGKAAGFDHDFTKPADTTILLNLLTRLLRLDKRLEKADELIEKQGEVVEQTKELMQEIKNELKEVKQDVQEIKEKLGDESTGG
jgi:two-component system, OmpR family, response regulator